MDIRHLQTFKTIVETGSFAGAADKLLYAQSTVTLQVQQLEATLKVELFDRQKKKIQLTEAGRLLSIHADYVLNQLESLQQSMTALVAGESGHIRMAVIEPLAGLRMPAILQRFCNAYPQMRLALDAWSTNVINEKAAGGEIDFGLTTPPPPGAGLTFEPLFIEPLVLLLPEKHPLARQEKLHLHDLSNQRLILTQPGCAYRALIERTLIERGAKVPACSLEIGSLAALKSVVQDGLGLALIPQMTLLPFLPVGLVSRNIEDFALKIPIGIVQKSDRPPPSNALNYLLDLLRSELKQIH